MPSERNFPTIFIDRGFEEAQEVFSHPYYLDQRSDFPEQYRAVGRVGEQLYTVIFEVREDEKESTTTS